MGGGGAQAPRRGGRKHCEAPGWLLPGPLSPQTFTLATLPSLSPSTRNCPTFLDPSLFILPPHQPRQPQTWKGVCPLLFFTSLLAPR